MKINIKVLGALLALGSIGVNLMSNWVSDKKMEEDIDKKVNEVLAKREES